MTQPLKEFGTRLKEILKERKASQTQLAARAGIDRSTINRLAGGSLKPSTEQIQQIAKALELTTEAMLVGVDCTGLPVPTPQPPKRQSIASKILAKRYLNRKPHEKATPEF